MKTVFHFFRCFFEEHALLGHSMWIFAQLQPTYMQCFCGHACVCFDAAVATQVLPALQYACQYLDTCFLDHLLEMLMMTFFHNAHPPISAGEDVEAVKPRVSQRQTNPLTANRLRLHTVYVPIAGLY